MRRLGWLVLGLWPFACATASDPATPVPPDAGEVVPEAGKPAPDASASDAGDDAGVDAAPPPVDCTTLAFCPEPAPILAQVSLNAVWGSSAEDVWAVGTRGTVLHREGGQLVQVGESSNEIFFTVWGADATTDPWILSASTPYRFGRSTHQLTAAFGASYTQNPYFLPRLWALGGSTTTDVVLAGQSTDVFGGVGASVWGLGTVDGSSAWLPNPTFQDDFTDYPTVRAVYATPSVAWAVSENGRSYRRSVETPTPPDDADASAPPPQTVWRYLPTESSRMLESVWASGPDDAWAVGALGTIQHFDASGAWHLQASPTAVALHRVWGRAPDDVWAVGDEATILHFDGSDWRRVEAPALGGVVPAFYGVWAAANDDVWIAGSRGLLHRTSANRSLP